MYQGYCRMDGLQPFKDQPCKVRVPVVRHCSPSPPRQQQRYPSRWRWHRTNKIQYVLNPGTYFDASMSMTTDVSRLASACFYQLRAFRRSIPTSTAVQLINSFVISRIDYCNSLFAGLPAYQLDPVQPILNFAARLIYREPSTITSQHFCGTDGIFGSAYHRRSNTGTACWCTRFSTD